MQKAFANSRGVIQLKAWLRKHYVVAMPVVAVVSGSAFAIAITMALGEDFKSALGRNTCISLAMSGMFYLFLRSDRKRKRSLEKQGFVAYLRLPESRPGSLDDLWDEGTAKCEPGQIIFQEVALNRDIPLGKALWARPKCLTPPGLRTPQHQSRQQVPTFCHSAPERSRSRSPKAPSN